MAAVESIWCANCLRSLSPWKLQRHATLAVGEYHPGDADAPIYRVGFTESSGRRRPRESLKGHERRFPSSSESGPLAEDWGTFFALIGAAVVAKTEERVQWNPAERQEYMLQALQVLSIRPIRWVPVVLAVALASGTVPALGQGITRAAEPTSAAVQSQPLDLVKSSITRVLAANGTGQQRIEARRVAAELFDFDEMCRRMLAEHWQESSPYQQGEFVRLFTEMLERSYLKGLRSVPAGAVTFLGETVNGSYAQVKSRIATSRFGETSVEYRLVDHGDKWAVYDVVLDGVSLVSSYRSQFASILRTSSFAQLLERLQSRQQTDPRDEQGP